MAIPIQNHKLTKEQYIKLFSNPVSGIACEIDKHLVQFENEHSFGVREEVNYNLINSVKNIRYSKSMILRALYFWRDYTEKYYNKIRKIRHPAINDHYIKMHNALMNFTITIGMVERYPNSYLFSHRHIQLLPSNKYSNALKIQQKLLQNKLFIKMIEFQESSLQPYYTIHDYSECGIEFTVFPCEHPYIPRQKISKVGITEKGNVFVLHKKDGAQRHREMMDIHRKVTGENKK